MSYRIWGHAKSYFHRQIYCSVEALPPPPTSGFTHIHAHTSSASTVPVYFTGSGLFLCWPYLSLPVVVIEECLYLPLLLSVTANTSGQVLALLCHSNIQRQRCQSCNPESMSWLSVYPSSYFHPYIIFLFILIMWSVRAFPGKTALLLLYS